MTRSIAEPATAEPASPAKARAAAFYDMDGTLVKSNVVQHYVFYALTDASLSQRASRIAGAAIRAPWYAALDRLDRRTFNEAFFRAFAGFSEDRLVLLKDELFETRTRPNVYRGARDLVAGDRRAGFLTVLVTGALDVVAEPLAKHLGFERVVCNRLAFDRDGKATGELVPPIIAGPEKAATLRRLAATEGIDLEASRAYSNDAEDLPFLSAVGRPIAVNPDKQLRASATAHGWPCVDLEPAGASLAERAAKGALSILRMLEPKR